MSAGKVTAAEVRAGLLRRFAPPECAVVFEVAQSTGHAARRHLDAVAMELWPSRGLALHGIEVKVSRADWRREKADPEKAEEIARFCDYFWIAAPEGLVPVAELPSAWGLLELKGEVISERRAARKTEAEELTRPFLAALLRAGGRGIDPDSVEAVLDKRRRLLDQEFDQRVELAAERKVRNRDKGADSWRALRAAIGEVADCWMVDEEIIEAVRLVLKCGVVKTWGGIRSLHDTVSKADKEMAAALRELGVEQELPAERILKSRVGVKRAGAGK